MEKYKMISREKLDAILDSPGELYEPFGNFICMQEIDGQTVWTAMKNEHGEGLTEDFVARIPAVRWLNGSAVREKNFWKPPAEDKELDKIRKAAEVLPSGGA